MARRAGAGTLKRRKDGKYEGRWTDENGRWRERVLSTDRGVAEAQLREIIAERDRVKAGLAPKVESLDLEGLVARYYAGELAQKSESHRRSVEGHLEAWKVELGENVNPCLIVAWHAQDFCNALSMAGRSNRTANAYLKSLKACLNWGVRMGYLDRNPIAGVRLLPEREKDQVRKRRALSDEECVRLLDEAAKGIPCDHFCAIELMLFTGLRYGELARLRWPDFKENRDRYSVTVRAEVAKSGKERTVPFFHAAMEGRIWERQGSPLWFNLDPNDSSALRASLYKALDAAGIPRVDDQGRRVDLHALRHTYGTRMARAGMSPALLMVLMGHAKIETTLKHYVHLEGEDARAIIDRVGGF